MSPARRGWGAGTATYRDVVLLAALLPHPKDPGCRVHAKRILGRAKVVAMNPWLWGLLVVAVALVWAWASDRRRRRRAGAPSQGYSADALKRAQAHADSLGRGDARDRSGF